MLDNLIFISMEGKKGFKINNFEVREDIELPLLVDKSKDFTPDMITSENIISGMIKILIDDPDNENIDYYRSFIFSVQPDIETRLTAIAYEAERNNQFKDALDIYRVLYHLKPDSLDHNLNIAICYDEYSHYLYSKGMETEASKFEDQAYQFYKKIEEFSEKNDRVYYYLGRFYLLKESFDKSIEYFREFIKITKDEDRKKEVIKILNDLIKNGLRDEDYQNAIVLIQSDKEDEAIVYIKKYINNYPNAWNGYYLMGWALRKKEQYDEAIKNFEHAEKLNPDSSDIYNEIGLCYLNQNIFNKSKIYFSKALKINPEDTAVIFNLALCSYKKGDKDESLRYCNVILEYNPNDNYAINLKKMIEESDN